MPEGDTIHRAAARVVVGLLVAAAVFAVTFWTLDHRRGSGPRGTTESASSGSSATTGPPPVPTTVPVTTTTAPPGLPLPLAPRPARIAWAGDSVADSLAAAVTAAAAARGVAVENWTISGCGMVRGAPADDTLVPIPFVATCDATIPEHNAAVAATGAEVVTWLSTWETANRVVDGQGYVFGTPEGDAALMGLIDQSAQALMAQGARLVFLTVPRNTTGPNRPQRDPEAERRTQHLNDLLRAYAAARADRVAVLDLASIVCPGGPPCPTQVDGVTLRPVDGGHFAGAGPAWVAPRVLDRLVG